VDLARRRHGAAHATSIGERLGLAPLSVTFLLTLCIISERTREVAMRPADGAALWHSGQAAWPGAATKVQTRGAIACRLAGLARATPERIYMVLSRRLRPTLELGPRYRPTARLATALVVGLAPVVLDAVTAPSQSFAGEPRPRPKIISLRFVERYLLVGSNPEVARGDHRRVPDLDRDPRIRADGL
jgi:hypothetical protein